MAAPRFDDLSAPSDFGAAAPPSPSSRPPATTGEPSAGGVSPEHVHYHDDEQRCDGCSNFGRGNQCSVLQMPVSPEGGCNAYQSGGAGTDDDHDSDVDTGAGADDTDDDYGV